MRLGILCPDAESEKAMKREVVTITGVRGNGVEYTTQSGNETGIYDPGGSVFPGVEVGQKWEIFVNYGGQFPTGKVVDARRLEQKATPHD